MRSTVEIDIAAPQASVAALFADPEQNIKWMHDIERYEPVHGTPGEKGSTYRLVPKRGNRIFTATVLEKDLPQRLQLRLVASKVTVLVTATLSAVAFGATRLTSQEDFKFSGFVAGLIGLVAQGSIRKAHRRHMEAFKRFAETELRAEH